MIHFKRKTDKVGEFSALAEEWWKTEGAFKILHKINPLRADYVVQQACTFFGCDKDSTLPLEGLSIIDIGCGGGLLAESLARRGANVTGLDASPETIVVAKQHAINSKLDIKYETGRAEDMIKTQIRYDIVTAFEIIEHVADVEIFLRACAHVLKPGGLFITSTFNRTLFSFLFGVIAAEYVLGWIPRGAHDWRKFVCPLELKRRLESCDIATVDMKGMVFNLVTGKFALKNNDLRINYFLSGIKGKK